ncbi:hypothetical protein GWI33_016078, partial [Rhynchophorus ferrugineus]
TSSPLDYSRLLTNMRATDLQHPDHLRQYQNLIVYS